MAVDGRARRARCSTLQRAARSTFDYGNNIRAQAEKAGVADAFDIPGLRARVHPPALLRRQGAVPLGGAVGRSRPTSHATDDLALEMFADDEALCRWIRLARERVAFQGLPARIFWLGYGERARFGLALNDLVRRGVVKAPIVIGRDHLDTGSVASPNRETEGMRDGSDAIADWPVLNALLNTSSGATWVSVHHGGGVGIGYSLHAGMVVVADGTREADEKLQRVLTCDPGLGVVRHADAGYPEAIDTARAHGIDMPSHAAREDRDDDDSGASGARTPRARRARRHRRVAARAFRSSSAAAAPAARRCCCGCAICIGATACQYVDVERIATTPERFLQALREASPFPRIRTVPCGTRRRDARASASTPRSPSSTRARAPGDAPATFLLDEFLELRTFESFPGLRTVLRDLDRALASSGNRFVLTTRYIARAHRLLRDAPAQFEIIHVAPLSAAEIRATLPAGADGDAPRHRLEDEDDRARDELARLVQALSDGRPAYARMIAETAAAMAPRGARRSGQRAGRAARARRPARRGAAASATSCGSTAPAATARSKPSSTCSPRKSR